MSASPVELIYKGLFGDVSFLRQLSYNYINALVQIDAMATVLKNKLGDSYLVILEQLISVDIASENDNDDDIFTFIIMLIKNVSQYKHYTSLKEVQMYYEEILTLMKNTLELKDKFEKLRLVMCVPFIVLSKDTNRDGGKLIRYSLMIFHNNYIDHFLFDNVINRINNIAWGRQFVVKNGYQYSPGYGEMIGFNESDPIIQLLLYYDSRQVLSYLDEAASLKYPPYRDDGLSGQFSIGTKYSIPTYALSYVKTLKNNHNDNVFIQYGVRASVSLEIDVIKSLRSVNDEKRLKEIIDNLSRIPMRFMPQPWLLTDTQAWENEQRRVRRRLDT